MTENATAARTVHVRVGHSGRAVHLAVPASGRAQAYTLCGAERRHVGVGRTYPVDAPVTCRACSSAPAPAAAPAPPPAPAPAARVSLWDGKTRRQWLLDTAARLEAEGKPEMAAEARAEAEAAR